MEGGRKGRERERRRRRHGVVVERKRERKKEVLVMNAVGVCNDGREWWW